MSCVGLERLIPMVERSNTVRPLQSEGIVTCWNEFKINNNLVLYTLMCESFILKLIQKNFGSIPYKMQRRNDVL